MKKLFIFLLVTIVSGCSVFTKQEPEVKYITKTEYITVSVPNKFRSNCQATRPMEPIQYVSMTRDQREEYLTDYAITLLGELRNCDKTRSGIIDLIDKNNSLQKENLNERKSKN